MKFMKSRGQGAMEYLTTYGWAILVVMVVGMVLWQMGVFRGGQQTATVNGLMNLKPIPSQTAYSSSSGTFSTALTNLVGVPIRIDAITIDEDYQTGSCDPTTIMVNDVLYTQPATVSKGDAFKISVNCGTRDAQSRYNMDISINYAVIIDEEETDRIENGFIEGAVE